MLLYTAIDGLENLGKFKIHTKEYNIIYRKVIIDLILIVSNKTIYSKIETLKYSIKREREKEKREIMKCQRDD